MTQIDELFDRLPDKIGEGKFDDIYRDADRVWHVIYKNKFGAVYKQTKDVYLSIAVMKMIDIAYEENLKK